MSAVVSRGTLGRWRYFGQNCMIVPPIEGLDHSRFLLDLHAEHGETCMVYCAALGYVSVVR